MRRSTSTLLLTAFVALVAPGAAHARPIDELRKAKLRAATATVTLSETRCPPDPPANCGKLRLEETFRALGRPATSATRGRPGFPRGLQIAGQGSGRCEEESATVTQTAPDGSILLLGSAARLIPGKFAATQVALGGSRRGVRVVWLEPLAPSLSCDFFDEPGTVLALPPSRLPAALVSPVIGSRVLKRPRFSITIAGSQDWNETAAGGTLVTGTASWKLRLDYVSRGRSAAGRRSGAR